MYIYHIFVDLSVLTKLAATIIEFSVIRSSAFGEKNFLPVSVDMRGSTERAFLNLWKFLLFLSLISLYQQYDS